jgi:RNA polymerase sigma factor (sigma-70 family)
MTFGGVKVDTEMVLENIGLVHMFAKKWEWRTKNTAADFDDLFSEGCIGLIKAIQTFDPERGYKFSTHACPQIEGRILTFLNQQLPLIHYPQQIRAMIRAIKNDDLTIRQVITRFKCSEKVATMAYDYAHTRVVSINAERLTIGEDTMTLEDIIPFIDDFSTAHADEFKSTLSGDERTLVDLIDRGLNKKEIAATVDIEYDTLLKKIASIGSRFRQYQAGLPYRGYRSNVMSDRHKIPQ